MPFRTCMFQHLSLCWQGAHPKHWSTIWGSPSARDARLPRFIATAQLARKMAEEFTVPKHNLGFFSFLSKDWCHLKHWNLPQVWIMFMLHHQDQGQIYNMRIYVYTYITYLFDVMYVYILLHRTFESNIHHIHVYVYINMWCIYFLCIHVYIYICTNGVDTCKELYTCHMYIYKIIIYYIFI